MGDEYGLLALYVHPPIWGLPSACPCCLSLSISLQIARIPHTLVPRPSDPLSDQLPALEIYSQVRGSDSSASEETRPRCVFVARGAPEIASALKEMRGIDLDGSAELFSEDERAEIVSIRSLVESLDAALAFEMWADATNAAAAGREFCRASLPWPLSMVEETRMKWRVKIGALGQHPRQVIGRAKELYAAISQRLKNNSLFFTNRPSSLDAALYSHLLVLNRTPLVKSVLQEEAARHANFLPFLDSMAERISGLTEFVVVESKAYEGVYPLQSLSHTSWGWKASDSRPKRSSNSAKVEGEDGKADGKVKRDNRLFLGFQALLAVVYLLSSTISMYGADDEEDEDDD